MGTYGVPDVLGFCLLRYVVISKMNKLVSVKMLFCTNNGLQCSVAYIALFLLFLWILTEVLKCSVVFAAPHFTEPNLKREEKRVWFAIIVSLLVISLILLSEKKL